MKSAFELALERSGGNLEEVDQHKKVEIAEIDAKYNSKMAEAKIYADERILKAGNDLALIEQIKNDLAVETASYTSKSENEKNRVRSK